MTQLAKLVEALQIPWPKALQFILLNLRFTPFRTHKLSPFEIVTEFTMHLAPASSDPQLKKGEILQYFKGLIASIKNNRVLVEPSFHSVPSGDIDFQHFSFQPEDFVYWKRHHQKKTLFNLTGKALIKHC